MEILYTLLKDIIFRGKRDPLLYFGLYGIASLIFAGSGIYYSGTLNEKYD